MDDTFLIYTNVTRFGTILFIIFTISILLNLFRYLMKLAAYHDARADALALTVRLNFSDAERFASFAKVLSAEKIEFVNTKTPIDHAIETAKLIQSEMPNKQRQSDA